MCPHIHRQSLESVTDNPNPMPSCRVRVRARVMLNLEARDVWSAVTTPQRLFASLTRATEPATISTSLSRIRAEFALSPACIRPTLKSIVKQCMCTAVNLIDDPRPPPKIISPSRAFESSSSAVTQQEA